MNMNSNSKTESTVLVLIFAVLTILLVGSFESRLANSNGDDHPVVWARYFSNPDFWRGDSNFIMAKSFAKATLPNLLAMVSVRWNQNFPILLSWIYVFIQNLGLGLAFYFFSRLWTQEKWIATAVALLSFAMTPWQLNLAYYPSMIHSPYPGHLVMPFLVIAVYFLVLERRGAMTLSLAIAGLIHPSQTLQFLFLLGLFLLALKKEKFQPLQYISFVPAVVTSLLVPFFFIPKFENPLINSELLPSALLNPHLVPWESTTFWPWGFPSIVAALLLSFLACRPWSNDTPKLKAFWWANIMALVVMGAIHFIGVKFKILSIILLCPFRVSVINSVLLAPIGFIYLLKKLQSCRWSVSWAAGSLVFFLLFSEAGLFWGPLLALAVNEFKKEQKSSGKIVVGIIMVWWMLFLLMGRPLREFMGPDVSGFFRHLMAPGANLTVAKIGLTFVFSLLLSFWVLWKVKSKKEIGVGLVLIASVFALFKSFQVGRESTVGEAKARWELQKWAKEFSPTDSVFLMETGSWRGVAQRKAQVVGYRKNQILPYFRNRESLEAELKLHKFYESYHTTNYNKLPDAGVVALANEFQGTHFIEKVEQAKRGFLISFENSNWRVYDLRAKN